MLGERADLFEFAEGDTIELTEARSTSDPRMVRRRRAENVRRRGSMVRRGRNATRMWTVCGRIRHNHSQSLSHPSSRSGSVAVGPAVPKAAAEVRKERRIPAEPNECRPSISVFSSERGKLGVFGLQS